MAKSKARANPKAKKASTATRSAKTKRAKASVKKNARAKAETDANPPGGDEPEPAKKPAKVKPSTPLGKAIDKGIEAGELNADHLVTYGKLREMKF